MPRRKLTLIIIIILVLLGGGLVAYWAYVNKKFAGKASVNYAGAVIKKWKFPDGPREGFGITKLQDGRILITGGANYTNNDSPSTFFDDAYIYNPKDGSAKKTKTNLTQPRRYHITSILPDGKVFIAGGEKAKNFPTKSIEIFNPADETFAAISSVLSYDIGGKGPQFAYPFGNEVFISFGQNSYTANTSEANIYQPDGKSIRVFKYDPWTQGIKAVFNPGIILSNGNFAFLSIKPAQKDYNAFCIISDSGDCNERPPVINGIAQSSLDIDTQYWGYYLPFTALPDGNAVLVAADPNNYQNKKIYYYDSKTKSLIFRNADMTPLPQNQDKLDYYQRFAFLVNNMKCSTEILNNLFECYDIGPGSTPLSKLLYPDLKSEDHFILQYFNTRTGLWDFNLSKIGNYTDDLGNILDYSYINLPIKIADNQFFIAKSGGVGILEIFEQKAAAVQTAISSPSPAKTTISSPTQTPTTTSEQGNIIESAEPANDYHAQYISQNGNPTLKPGESYKFDLKLKNSGKTTWKKDKVFLGTDRDQDRIPIFIREDLANKNPSGWASDNRIAMQEPQARPGETATFSFYYTAPKNLESGNYKEYFRPVAEGITWMEDYGIYWEIKTPSKYDILKASTNPSDYHAQYVSQNVYPTVQAGKSFKLEVKFKNIGTATWYKDIVRLGTSHPHDWIPSFIREDKINNNPSGWVSPNRVGMQEDKVKPGETATFSFWQTVPAGTSAKIYRGYYQPIADDITWMEDFGVYWDVIVK